MGSQSSERTVVTLAQAVDAQPRVALGDLPTLDLSQRLNRRQSRVLRERKRDRIEGGRERAHRILLDRSDLVGLVRDGDGARNLGCASAVDDAVVADEVADDAEGVVERSLGLVDDLRAVTPISTANEPAKKDDVTILFDPRTKTVTAFELAQSSITSILSRVVPNETSRTTPARPSLAAERSSKRGTMRPLVAMAMSCTAVRVSQTPH